MKISRHPHSFLVLAIGLGLSGCSGDNFISKSFRGKPPETLAPEGGYGPTINDQRPLVAQVTSLKVENTLGGAIIRATGLSDGQGYWDAGLVAAPADTDSSSVLRLEFRIRPPETPAPGGAQPTREVTAAVFASNFDLNGIRTITVVAAQNSQSTRR